MTKAVFRPGELELLGDIVVLDPPTSYPELAYLMQEDESEIVSPQEEEYTGPTIEEIRQEIEQLRSDFEAEKEEKLALAKLDAERIIKKAEDSASGELNRGLDEAEAIKTKAEEEAEAILAAARTEAEQILSEGRAALDEEKNEAREQGQSEGRESGYNEGKAEVERLVERTQKILEKAQDKRGEILVDTEREIVHLVLLIARKIIKTISENQKDVIISNVIEALRKVKTKGDISIKVNLADLELATEHKKEFIDLVEGVKSIQVLEDSTVDAGGCIIETDFGEIDARIASQLAELEAKILEISPIRNRSRNLNSYTGADYGKSF